LSWARAASVHQRIASPVLVSDHRALAVTPVYELLREHVVRLLKNYFKQPDRAVHGSSAHFSNMQVFEKWSKAKIILLALRAQNVMEGVFQHLL
jgi:hypothetical protein